MRIIQPIAPDVFRIKADNPSPLTGTGTNSYLLRGTDGAVLIDPGPDTPAHLGAILAALAGEVLQAILITHPHVDHSAAAPKLAAITGAQIYSFGPAPKYDAAAQEGADLTHYPDITLPDGAQIVLAGLPIDVIHTPGHMQGHLCFGWQGTLFSGDHVMGWATSLVSPPEGDMAAYRASLRKLQGQDYARYLPGHGEAIENPKARLAELIAHRDMREAQIRAALKSSPATALEIAAQVYHDIPDALRPAAARNVLAHLIELTQRALVKGDLTRALKGDITAPFALG